MQEAGLRETAGGTAGRESVRDGVLGAARLFLICRTGTRHFAVETCDVIETLRPFAIEALADVPPFVRGYAMIRGKPVALVDIGMLLGEAGADHQRIVTVRAGKNNVGLLVDAVIDLRVFPPDLLSDMPALFGSNEAFEAIATLDEELVVFLKAARVISEDVLAKLEEQAGHT